MASLEVTEYTVYPSGYAESALPDKVVFAITVNNRGKGWSVEQRGFCLTKDGDWEYQPIPSERDDDFFARCRFTEDEARRLALEVVDQVAVNGRTLADIDHLYGEDRSKADEVECRRCGWPFKAADPACGHEVAADD